MTGMLSVNLIMRALPGQAEELAQFWCDTGKRVLANEPGCKLFHVSRNLKDPEEFTIFQVYESQKAFDLHHTPSPQSAEILAKLNTLRQAPIQRIIGNVFI